MVRTGRTLGAKAGAGNQQLLTLADPNGDARAVVDGASQAEAHLTELSQPQHVQVDKAIVAEQSRFYNGPMDVDEAAIALAEQINQTYWDNPGTQQQCRMLHMCRLQWQPSLAAQPADWCWPSLHHYMPSAH